MSRPLNPEPAGSESDVDDVVPFGTPLGTTVTVELTFAGVAQAVAALILLYVAFKAGSTFRSPPSGGRSRIACRPRQP
jgi:hypothetical protein